MTRILSVSQKYTDQQVLALRLAIAINYLNKIKSLPVHEDPKTGHYWVGGGAHDLARKALTLMGEKPDWD